MFIFDFSKIIMVSILGGIVLGMNIVISFFRLVTLFTFMFAHVANNHTYYILEILIDDAANNDIIVMLSQNIVQTYDSACLYVETIKFVCSNENISQIFDEYLNVFNHTRLYYTLYTIDYDSSDESSDDSSVIYDTDSSVDDGYTSIERD